MGLEVGMNAREGIERLLYAYSDTIDRGDFVATGRLFAPEGLYGRAGSSAAACGPEQVTGALAGNVRLYDGVPRTRHCVSNVVIDVDPSGETAQVQSYVHVHHQPPGLPLITIACGTYRDRVHIVDGEWRFAERRMHIELVGDMSTHLVRSTFRND
jgi:hypothetical protein